MAEASLKCPHCGKPLPRPPGARCPSCGQDISGAFLRRATPVGRPALEDRRLPWVLALVGAPLLLGMAWIEYNDLTELEAHGGTYSDNGAIISLYKLTGKWGVVGLFALLGVFALWSAFKLFVLQRRPRRS